MAMKIPCVVSTLANNAIHAPINDCLLIADSPGEYAEKIVDLLSHPGKAEKISENAFRFVRENFHWTAAVKKLEDVIQLSFIK